MQLLKQFIPIHSKNYAHTTKKKNTFDETKTLLMKLKSNFHSIPKQIQKNYLNFIIKKNSLR